MDERTQFETMVGFVEDDLSALSPSRFESQEAMGRAMEKLLHYDPTTYWDKKMMKETIQMLADIGDPNREFIDDNTNTLVDNCLNSYNVIKPEIMTQVAQKTIKKDYNKDIAIDGLKVNLDYLIDQIVFGNDYDEDVEDMDEDEDNSDSILDDNIDEEDEDSDEAEFNDEFYD